MSLQRWMIFAVALLVRLGVAYVFFGSVDVTNSMLDAERLIAGWLPSELTVPYFPGVQALIWTAGVIGFHTALPVTFLYKFFGCLFDAVIAAAVFEYRGPRAGWFYALAPVPIFIVAVHGQWDSISIAFFIMALVALRRPGAASAFCAGAFYVLAVIAKPIVVPFVVFLFARRRIAALLAGMAVAFAAYLAVLWAIGDPLTDRTILWVLDYARTGMTYLGLPHALGIEQNRLLLLLPILVLVPLYWTGRIEREDAVMFSYAFILGTAGLGAQYLFWLVPFLLMRGYERFAAIYSVLAGIYLALFYTSIGATRPNHENLGALAPLRGWSWLTPGNTEAGMKVQLLLVIGNVLLPLACLAFAVIGLWRRSAPIEAMPPATAFAPMIAALLITLGLLTYALRLPRPTEKSFVTITRARVEATYNVVRIVAPNVRPGEPTWVVPPVKKRLDVTTLAFIWIGLWAYLIRSRVWPSSPS